MHFRAKILHNSYMCNVHMYYCSRWNEKKNETLRKVFQWLTMKFKQKSGIRRGLHRNEEKVSTIFWRAIQKLFLFHLSSHFVTRLSLVMICLSPELHKAALSAYHRTFLEHHDHIWSFEDICIAKSLTLKKSDCPDQD